LGAGRGTRTPKPAVYKTAADRPRRAGPVLSWQLTSDALSSQYGPVRPSSVRWNDKQNDIAGRFLGRAAVLPPLGIRDPGPAPLRAGPPRSLRCRPLAWSPMAKSAETGIAPQRHARGKALVLRLAMGRKRETPHGLHCRPPERSAGQPSSAAGRPGPQEAAATTARTWWRRQSLQRAICAGHRVAHR
jgi:hypothetical protein